MHLVPHILQLNGIVQTLWQTEPDGIMRLELLPLIVAATLRRGSPRIEKRVVQQPLHRIPLLLLAHGGLGVAARAVHHKKQTIMGQDLAQKFEEMRRLADAPVCVELVQREQHRHRERFRADNGLEGTSLQGQDVGLRKGGLELVLLEKRRIRCFCSRGSVF